MALIVGIGLSASCGKLVVPGKKSMVTSVSGTFISLDGGTTYTKYTSNLGFGRGGCVSGDGSTYYFGLANDTARISKNDGVTWNTCSAVYSYNFGTMVCSYNGYYACGSTSNYVRIVGNNGTTNILNYTTSSTAILDIDGNDDLTYIYAVGDDGVLYKFVNYAYSASYYYGGTSVSVSPSGQYVAFINQNYTQFYLSTDYGNTFTSKPTGDIYFSCCSVTNDFIYFKRSNYAQMYKYDLLGNYISAQSINAASQNTVNFIVSRDSKYFYFEYGNRVYVSTDGGANFSMVSYLEQDNQLSINR